MARLRKLPREEWRGYFDAFSRRFLSDASKECASAEVVSQDLGDQLGADHVRVFGVSYDPHDDALQFHHAAGDHRLFSPKEIWVQEDDRGFVGLIEVVRPDDTREIFRLSSVAIVPVR